MISKRVFVVASVISILLMSLALASAITGKIGNARAVLYPEVGFFGVTIDRTIYVENVNNEAVNISLDSGNSTMLKLIDKNFVLEPGESKEAKFEIVVKKTGDYIEKLNVLFTPLDGTTGVALSSTYIIHARGKDASEQDENSTDTDSGTSVIKMQNLKENKSVIAVGVSTLVLAVLLIILLILSKKRRGKVKKKRVNDRKG